MKMRFPYFYQLMTVFLLIILTLMAITSGAIFHFGRQQIVSDVEETFLNYVTLIEETRYDERQLEIYHSILRNQDIEYGIYTENGVLAFPNRSEQIQVELTDEEHGLLASGEMLLLRTEGNNLRNSNKKLATIYVPIFSNQNEYRGFIGIGRPVSYIEENINELRNTVFHAFFYATIATVIMSVLFSYFLVKRVNRLSKATQRVASGDYDIYIDHSNRDEIDRLSADFNVMTKSLSEWRKEVRHLEERRKTFMQDVAHEMRTPLTTINGLLEGLEYNVFDEEQEMRSIKLMSKETKRLIRLVNENLDYENIQSNRIILHKQSFPLDEVVTEISEQLATIAKDSNNEIVVEETSNDIYVYADFDRFKQIIVNLVKNALQFTTNGTVTITAKESKTHTEIMVEDNGIGMNEEQLTNIWDRYYKADPSRKNTKHGESGLGLPIVKQLMELHDGEVTVESELDVGTKILLRFPRLKQLNEKK